MTGEPASDEAARGRALDALRAHTGREAEVVARAPGRVNLIGEHTDYNDGFVLPMAIPHSTWMAARRRDDDRIRLWSEGHPPAELSVGALDQRNDGWAVYVQGVARIMVDDGVEVPGFDAAFTTTIPVGASLSSSAALDVATVRGIGAFAGVGWDPVEAALVAVRADNEHVGVPCGVMDQLICAAGRAGEASLIDCRSLTIEPVPLPDDVAVVVLDTGTRRRLAESAYADRRAACERVADALGLPALRDATAQVLDRAVGIDETDRRRAAYVVAENDRTLRAAAAMRAGDAETLGRLMAAGHAGLRDDYEVSSPALDAMVDAATKAPGCVGARMTGGGFAGCAVAVVDRTVVDSFIEVTLESVRAGGRAGPVEAVAYRCEPSDGATLEWL